MYMYKCDYIVVAFSQKRRLSKSAAYASEMPSKLRQNCGILGRCAQKTEKDHPGENIFKKKTIKIKIKIEKFLLQLKVIFY